MDKDNLDGIHMFLFQTDWGHAIQKCKENAGAAFASSATLVSIHSHVENIFIHQELQRISQEDGIWDLGSAWIGLSKRGQGRIYKSFANIISENTIQ